MFLHAPHWNILVMLVYICLEHHGVMSSIVIVEPMAMAKEAHELFGGMSMQISTEHVNW